MARQRIRRHAGGTMDPAHLHQNWLHLHQECHLCPERLLCHLVTGRKWKVMKLKVCHPGVCIYILLFPILNFPSILHMPRIASAIKSIFQICWVHYLLRGNATDIDFEDESSLLRESGSEEEHWLNGMGFWVLSLSTISGHFKVYFKGYIYMLN